MVSRRFCPLGMPAVSDKLQQERSNSNCMSAFVEGRRYSKSTKHVPLRFAAARSDDTMSHLGAFVPEVGAFDARICGKWEGTTSEALGGYRQIIEFEPDCINAKITVMGQSLGETPCSASALHRH